MNFDFLKNLRGLNYIYENCTNAEKLALSMPIQSAFTSRKSAELLAKFIYMTAHKEKMEDLSFADILTDPDFLNFMNNNEVINAFHKVRISGNNAVHGADESSINAVDILEKLHFIAGETAQKLSLIDGYPSFDKNIEKYSDAKVVDEEDINKKAMEMFNAYISELEQDQYIEQSDYDWLGYSMDGVVDMHEYLEVLEKPKDKAFVTYVQDYLFYLLTMSIRRADLEDGSVSMDVKLTIDGESFDSSDIKKYFKGLDKLPLANSFTVDCYCDGNLKEYYNDYECDEDGHPTDNVRTNMIRKDAVWRGSGMFDHLGLYKRHNPFIYKLAIEYSDSGEMRYEKIENGKEIDILSKASEDIIDKEYKDEWFSMFLELRTTFDFDKYSSKYNDICKIVRQCLPKDQLSMVERHWIECETMDKGSILPGIQWNCKSLKEVQVFLDKINEVLLPIKDEIAAYADGYWEVKEDFAVATWEWTDTGFKVKGILY